MSSRPTAFILDDEDDWGSITPTLSSTRSSVPPASTTSATSGEFNAFTVVGSALAGGGGSKKALWFLPTDKVPCLGKVGNLKFCVKDKSADGTCGTARHATKFRVEADVAYIHSTDNQILGSPVLPIGLFSASQRAKLLSMMLSVAEWEKVFQAIKDGEVPEWLIESGLDATTPTSDPAVALLSPSGTSNKQGIFEILPTFSFESAASDGNLEVSPEGRIDKVEGRLKSLQSKLSRPFMDIEVSYTLVMADLKTLHARVEACAASVGLDKNLIPVWKTLQEHSAKVNFAESAFSQMKSVLDNIKVAQEDFHCSLNNTMEELAEVQATTGSLPSWVEKVNNTLEVFSRRFNVLKPMIERSSNTVFQSFDDLHSWVKTKLPKGRFGLFVDGHSFLEFFSLSGHIDTEAGAAAFSHSQKAGFSTYIEAQLAISFKNLFPQVFGRGGSGSLDDSECLPAISSGDKWNNGSTGVHHQLMRNMNDVSYQIDSMIKKVLKDHFEARQLAIDCATASKRFVIDLIAFMTQEYATWQQRGFNKRDSWQTVCQLVRRIFEDLQSARISARNVQDFEDSDFTTASFIYATLKCHGVMESYVCHQFHAHPHISSVITRHLAANFVKPDLSAASLENKVKALATKVDSHESKIKVINDKLRSPEKESKEKGKRNKNQHQTCPEEDS